MGNEDSKKLQRFGRYLLLDHLVDGGMAKISRARFLGEQADKVVAIKMVRPQFSQDDSFKTMFMDEIKVAFGLQHPNIVQTYDYGIQNEQLYVAMEYCDGQNLKEYMEKLLSQRFVFPIQISVHIVSQVCQGLHYAHNFTDKLTGQKSNIIHRDISPHNIMITYDGDIKVIDFGIAKASTNSEATQAGTIKGKLSYLAPEYLEGHDLDHRYDQFAVGITLWELLCSRKLFKAENDLAVLKQIQACEVPAPSSINPNVPKELDQIILKSLSKDRNQRFESLDQMNRSLVKFLYAHYPDFSAGDLGHFAKKLFKKEITEDRAKLVEFGKIDLAPYIEELKSRSSDHSSDQDKTRKNIDGQELDFGFSEKTSSGTNSWSVDKTISLDGDRGSTTKVTRKTVVGTRVTGVVGGKTSTKMKRVTIEKKESSSIFKIASLAIVLSGIYFFKEQVPYVKIFFPQEKGLVEADLKKQSVKKKIASVELSGLDLASHLVFINEGGRSRSVRPDALGIVEVPAGREIHLRIESRSGEKTPYIKKLRLSEGEDLELNIDSTRFPAANVDMGELQIRPECLSKLRGKEIQFELNGEKRIERIPFKYALKFPIKKSFTVKIVDPQDTSIQKSVNFTIKRKYDYFDLCEKL